MYFNDRYDAAMQLAPLLEKYKNEKGVILAVPRGGVPIGYYLAKYLDFPLDLLMTKKLGHPGNEEFAIGAVSLEGSIVEETTGVPEQYIREETRRIREQLKERYIKFMGNKEPVDIKGKIIIVVDDGVATGRTILSTIKILRNKEPRKIVVAVPVASEEAADRIREVVDDFICLHTPYPFYGVGRFYADFTQVEDEDVLLLLNELNTRGKVA
ncbi:MAG: phosphoribosyltransferase [Chitinophagaceae bacterium]|nr:phosphoribosyltransferase [Chitinophagaceae bacterium]MBL0307942.1 phosphoribosyltransferase [Chitinophagaceae bacterium]MBP6215685.1 phosphoribosyltransferase [Chitinophagaceae bacterium]HQV61706.1 phosphoribosyltransferase family protein [Chitinophagaceae bacterium]HQV86140.1 phosphoribosyltransferase family protein [Chitinophagaceae bacterium]